MNSVANLQWYLIAATFWVLIWRPRGRAGSALACVTVVLAVTTAPLALLLAPIAGLRLLTLPSWRERLPALSFAGAGLIQLAVIAGTTRPVSPVHPGVGDVVRAYLVRVVLGGVDGFHTATRHFREHGWTAVAVACLFVLLLIGLAATTPPGRRLVAVGVGEGLVLFVFSVGYAWSPMMAPSGAEANLGMASRYTLAPVLLLTGVLVVGVESLHDRVTEFSRSRLSAGTSVMTRVLVALLPMTYLIGVDLAEYRSSNARAIGPRWSVELARAADACLRPGTQRVSVAIAPGGGWTVQLSCAELRNPR